MFLAVRNQKGSGIIYSSLLIMFAATMLAIMMVLVSSVANVLAARRAINSELATVSYEITQQTYKAMREGNLTEYERSLLGAEKQNELRQQITENISQNYKLQNDNLKVYNVRFELHEEDDCIVYTVTCDATYYFRLLWHIPYEMRDCSFTGMHKMHLDDSDPDPNPDWY